MMALKQLVGLFLILLLVTACGGSSSSTPAGGSTSGAAAAAPTAVKAEKGLVKVGKDAKLGSILTDGAGMTLYVYLNDEQGKSNCESFCLQSWPAYEAPDGPKAGEGAQSSMLSTITRSDGKKQVTYNGWPLYQYRADTKEGEVKGQNSSQLWYVITPEGEFNKTVP